MSHFDFSKIKRGIDSINSFELDDARVGTKNTLIKNKLLPLLQKYNVNLTYDDIAMMDIPIKTLLTLTDLTIALNNDKVEFIDNETALFDNQILIQLTPILSKIDNINKRYDGKPPAKYFNIATYMSDEEMINLGLTNEQRSYYIKRLFQSKTSTTDIPKNLRPYILTDKDSHKLIYKRRIPIYLEKEFWFFFVKFYTTDKKNYPKFVTNQNNAIDLETEFRHQINILSN